MTLVFFWFGGFQGSETPINNDQNLKIILELTPVNQSCFCFTDTFGLESVFITDTTGGRVCLECSFYSFSTDTGCIVELLISGSNIIQYNGTINRSGGGTVKGCVSEVTEGVYDVRVYDQSSSSLIETLTGANVTEHPTITTTSTGRTISSTTTTSNRGIRYSTSASTRTGE